MRRFLVLSIFLFSMFLSFSIAHAVVIESNATTANILGNGQKDAVRLLGVTDYAPGNDLVVPFICAKEMNNNLDMLWAIAETQSIATRLYYYVYTASGDVVYNADIILTPKDVESDSCKSLVSRMTQSQRAMLEKTIAGVVYYVGYIVYEQSTNYLNNIIGWQYLVDLSKGFASGFNSYSVQNNVSANLCETTAVGLTVCSTAAWMYPRFYLMNNLPDSFNWWIILAGTNDISRTMDGFICDESERCVQLSIPIPSVLNIINVSDYLPYSLFAMFPKAGYGSFSINAYTVNNTIMGWAYQRAASTSGVSLSWSVIHPIHKEL